MAISPHVFHHEAPEFWRSWCTLFEDRQIDLNKPLIDSTVKALAAMSAAAAATRERLPQAFMAIVLATWNQWQTARMTGHVADQLITTMLFERSAELWRALQLPVEGVK